MNPLLASPCGLALLLIVAGAQAADPALTSETPGDKFQGSAEIGFGHEHYSSPLVRFNDQGPLIEILGRRHADGDYQHLSASAMKSFTVTPEVSLQASAAVWHRHFANAPDLDVGIVTVDSMVRFQTGQSSIGIGPSFQQIASGGRPFRERVAAQIDWTRFKEGKGYRSVVFETGDNRHSDLFRDLDSRSSLLLVREQFVTPIDGVQDVSVEAGVVRESNRFGYSDLSSRQSYVRFSLGFAALGLDWNFAGTAQKSRFDGPLIDTLPAREDVFYAGDFSASYPLSKDTSVRWTVSGYQNRANMVLYDGWFRGNSLSLSTSF